MSSYQQIVKDIKALKIQGATNVAESAVRALAVFADKNKNKNKIGFMHNIKVFKKIIFDARPTEPAMRNAINYVLGDIEVEENYMMAVKQRAKEVSYHFKESAERISQIGAKKIRRKMIIFTHCHSSAVVDILIKAKKRRINFEVHNTETRPRLQGRITARELARAGIPVIHYVDSAARLALKKADLMLIGADAITTEGKVINKIGSELFAELAHKHDIPVYACTDSWKFDPETIFGFEEEIEERTPKEIWPNPPKGVEIDNHAFEKVDADLITGIISELGIYSPNVFVDQIRRAYPWI